MKLSYEYVRKIHRLEKSSVKLVRLDDSFLDSINSFIIEEKNELKKDNNYFDDSKLQRFNNIKSMLEDILYLRQKKIINLSIMRVKTGEDDILNMLRVERAIYDNIIKMSTKYLSVLNEISMQEVQEDILDLIIVKEVPKFIGTDMKEYGPYFENDKIRINSSIAKLLINKGIAKKEDVL